MSESMIKDGTGTGNRVRVDTSHRLQTRSVVRTDNSAASFYHGAAFTLPMMEIGDTGLPLIAATEFPLLWFQNKDPNRVFSISRYYLGWNGGDATGAKCIKTRLYVGSGIPTANFIAFAPPNLNLTSKNPALALAYAWTRIAGNGMTLASPGQLAQSMYMSRGLTTVPIDGTFILGYGDIICVAVVPEEVGKFSMIISGCFETPQPEEEV